MCNPHDAHHKMPAKKVWRIRPVAHETIASAFHPRPLSRILQNQAVSSGQPLQSLHKELRSGRPRQNPSTNTCEMKLAPTFQAISRVEAKATSETAPHVPQG